MMTIGPLAFTAPWLLLGLGALPVLWFMLRAVPPAPMRRRFPGVSLLLGLADDETQTDRTPWWLLMLRVAAVAAVIVGFAGPVLNPQAERTGNGPLVIAVDGTWVDARFWDARLDRIDALLSEAGQNGRLVALVTMTDPPVGALKFQSADVVRSRLAGLRPLPWPPAAQPWIEATEGDFETFWMSDGLVREDREEVLSRLEVKGPVTVFEEGIAPVALRPPTFEGEVVVLRLLRAAAGGEASYSVAGYGLDPSGVPRVLVQAEAIFPANGTETELRLSLPPELRNRVTRFQIVGIRAAGAVMLTDEALRQRKVALITGREDRERLQLLSPFHFLRQALKPTADLIDVGLSDAILTNPDVIVLADLATLSGAEAEALTSWVENGGTLLRFAGPRLAASDVSRTEEDPLMPVRLRAGGRILGGAMSWGEPKTLRPFGADSPFFGLEIPEDVTVSAQVMAQPDPQLSARVIAALSDGTPLVTRKHLSQGQIVLFHITANTEWSSLPLSGLFVRMLERLTVSSGLAALDTEVLAGITWRPREVMDAFGDVRRVDILTGVAGAELVAAPLSAELPPGLYEGGERSFARNVIGAEEVLEPMIWPARIPVEGMAVARETALKGGLLTAALALLMADILASLWLVGRLTGPSVPAIGLMTLLLPLEVRADDLRAIEATREVVLAHVITGDSAVDRVARAGLRGLGDTLFRRTSIEPANPISVNLETDDLAFYPLLYWPISPAQPMPSDRAYAKLNEFLRNGGMVLFDTRDADLDGFGTATPEGRKLQQLAAPLDIPPLEPIPKDHVLTRAFYLLQDFPGRHVDRQIWVEAAPPDAEQVEGMPFRNINDGVTPVVIGGNDWAAAWAVDERGEAMFPVGRGYAGERQRELAFRFGVNLMMHVLTGNYKSDQVHVPALLDRLGQ